MTPSHPYRIFEKIADAPFTANGIRPGGLDLTRQLIARSSLSAGDRILDIGCGTGVTVGCLRLEYAMEAVGIDASVLLVSQGKARNRDVPLVTGDAGTLPFSDSSFHCVLLECTLSLVPDQERILREAHRVLKPRGRLMVTDIYARNPRAIGTLRTLPVQSCLSGALDKDKFVHDCSAAGFIKDCFEDHSEMLKDFAAQIIWTYGSLDALCTGTQAGNQRPESARCAIKEARPGYFLYLGSKTGVPFEVEGKLGNT